MEAEAEVHEEAKGMDSQKQTGKATAKKPPHNYVAIVKASAVPIQTSSLDKLCDQLYDGVVLQEEGKRLRKYWVDRHLNKNCFMVLARELAITWGDMPQYWKWKTVRESGNVDVEEAELIEVCWLEVRGKFRTVVLSPNTLYEVSLVASITESSQGWPVPLNMNITLPDGKKLERMESLQHMLRGKPTDILMGKFMTSSENIGEITFCISETSSYWKQGLVVKGVAFRPKN